MKTIQTTQVNVPQGMINFGIGQPAPALLPLVELRKAAAHRLGQDDSSLLAYGAAPGDGHFRLVLARFLSEGYGLPVEAGQLLVTNGASQGLDMLCTFFANPGDTIFVEEPSYFLALRIFADHHLNVVGIPMDENGIIIEALEEKLKERQPVFLYTIPTFHNPSSITLSAARRKRLVELSKTHNFLIVADEVYQLLGYTVSPPRPLAGYVDAETVLSVGSFSKILAPGLRLGWIQAAPALLEPMVNSGMLDSGGGLNPFASAIVCSVIELGLQHVYLGHLKTHYQQCAATLSGALHRRLPSISFIEPGGGFFVWLRFPDEVDTEALLVQARQHNVGFEPGISFSSQKGLRNYARLSFAYYDLPELEEGVDRLAHAIEL